MIIDCERIAMAKKDLLKAAAEEPCVLGILTTQKSQFSPYFKGLIRDCEDMGWEFIVRTFKNEPPDRKLSSQVEKFCRDVDGVIVLADEDTPKDTLLVITSAIPYQKDIDGMSLVQKAMLCTGGFDHVIVHPPATARAVRSILEDCWEDGVAGKKIVVVGRGPLAGHPTAMLLRNMDAFVCIAHSKTPDWKTVAADAYILATNTPVMNWQDLHPGSVIIDLGCGYKWRDGCNSFEDHGVAITPQKKGIGLVTRAELLTNLFRAYNWRELHGDK